MLRYLIVIINFFFILNYDYFLISHNKSIKDYPVKKLEELLLLIKNEKCDVGYDGNDTYYTEIVSINWL